MKILVAIDLSDATETIVNKTEAIAKAASAQIYLVHVAQSKLNPLELQFDIEPQEERDLLAKRYRDEHCQIQEISARLRHEGLEATALLVREDKTADETATLILEKAEKLDVDMIVVGSHGKGMMAQIMMGSVSQSLLKRSDRPVMIIPTTNSHRSYQAHIKFQPSV